MLIYFEYLLPALFLLFFPRKWMRFGWRIGTKASKRAAGPYTEEVVDPKDISIKAKEQFCKLRNWIDFGRALAGGIAIVYFCFAVDTSLPKKVRLVLSHYVLTLEIVLLVVAMVFQTIKPERRLTLVAPVFFVLGLSFGVLGWKAALFSFIIIWAINVSLPSVTSFLLAFATVEMGFGLIPKVGSSRTYVIVAVCLTLIPVLLSAVTKRRLTQLSKKMLSKREIVKE